MPGDLKPPAKQLGDLVSLSMKYLPTTRGCEIKCPRSVMNFHVCIICSLAFKVCWANPDGGMQQNQNSNEPGGSELVLLCYEWGCTKLSYMSKGQQPAHLCEMLRFLVGVFVCYSCWVNPSQNTLGRPVWDKAGLGFDFSYIPIRGNSLNPKGCHWVQTQTWSGAHWARISGAINLQPSICKYAGDWVSRKKK